MLENLITSKTRLRLLIKFFINISNEGYLNGLATEFNESTNSIRKELNNLSSVGYLKKQQINNKVIYSANNEHPLFSVLQKIIRTHLGIEDIITRVLNQLGDVYKIFLVGDYAKGIDSGIIEIILVGENVDEKYLKNLKNKIEIIIERKVKFTIKHKFPAKDFILLS
jgi:hypothetical protein